MKITSEKLILLGADFLILDDYTEVTWRELCDGEWVEKKRKITREKSKLIVEQAGRIRETQLLMLN